MKYTFRYLTLYKQSEEPYKAFISDLTALLSSTPAIESEEAYNAMLFSMNEVIKKHDMLFQAPSPLYTKEIEPIKAKKALTEPTPWGGVSLKKVDVENDYIQKLLVIGKYGILGFEIHDYKHEHLNVLEGLCLFIHSVHNDSNWKEGVINVSLVKPKDTITLLPGDEHGMIALTDCVVEETSTNHLDDLIFIFNSNQIQ